MVLLVGYIYRLFSMGVGIGFCIGVLPMYSSGFGLDEAYCISWRFYEKSVVLRGGNGMGWDGRGRRS